MQRALLLFLLAVGCATGPKRSSVVVVLGSSTAAGAGLADPSTSWVNRYATYLGPRARVHNLAVPGATTFAAQPSGKDADPAHNITAALALHPDTIIINFPSNDAANGVPVDQTLANIATIVKLASDAHATCWVATSQPRTLPPENAKLLLELRDRVLHDYGNHAIDFFTPLAGPDNMLLPAVNQGDGIHPNPEGHRLLFEQVKRVVQPHT